MSNKEYSPEVVGQSFIKQYYEMFAKNPAELHRFYKDESSFSHAEGHQVVTSVTSIESIRECISDLQLAGCRLDLSEGSIDAQRSEQGGVFLVVTGNLMLPGKPYHHFVQSFFLSCQSNKGTSPSYYVRNSIFRLLGPVDSNSTPPSVPLSLEAEEVQATEEIEATAQEPQNSEVEVEPVDAVVETPQEVSSQVVQEEVQMNGFENEPHPDHQTVASEPEYVNVTIRDNLETQNDEDQAEVEFSNNSRSVQRSFAELVKGWGDKGSPELPPTQAVKPKVSKPPASESVSPPTVSEKGPTIHLAPETTGPPSALYLNQLPEDVTSSEQLAPLFTPYGPIRKIDVHPKGYAFVNYIEAPSVAKVLELAATTPEIFSVNGHVIQVREKINKPKIPGGKDKKIGDKFKKEGWKPRDKMSQGEKKPMPRAKSEKPQAPPGAKAAAAPVSKK